MFPERFRPWQLAAAILAASALVPAASQAQSALTLSGGRNSWDLSGTGSGWSGGAAFERGLTDGLGFEARIGYFAAPDADDDPFRALLPEIGVVLSTPTRIPLRLTLGAGWSLGLGGWPEDDLTLIAAAGTHLGLANAWGIRPELRVRSVDPWVGTIAEFNLGLVRTVGR